MMKKMAIDRKNYLNADNARGFTLIELSLVIIIVGILVVPMLQMYSSYLLRKEMIVTRENVQNGIDGISLVQALGRYPCPSDRSLPPGNANYGLEQCNLTAIPLCTAAGLQGICRAISAFDRDLNGANDEVIIGGLPLNYYTGYTAGGAPIVATLSRVPYMQGEKIIDGWKNKLTYAVTANVTRPNRTTNQIQRDSRAGVISALDENGNGTAGITDNGLFVVLSHGKDAQGAFSLMGVSFNNCSGTARGENCDEDTTFMQGVQLSEGADPFDDISKFFILPEGELWRLTGTLDAFGSPLPHIRNMNNDNVGVNISAAPVVKLEVGGTLRADSVRTDNICDEAGANCFRNSTLFGTGMGISSGSGATGVCDSGQVVIGILNGQISCGRPTFTTSDPAGTTRVCPTGRYVTSVLTNACIICNDGSKVCS